ncbi:DnaD domain protein [Cohnella algarum]|uniref:DnaD domain protein n=1 Tax=Cohnella algarum TaxID=2044859 RepID=UPI001966E5C9|nr:DnaD domain protein [Cohnella algarum]MBN2982858.1 DnaD domain protein [Cohnella algarum]
MRVSNRLEFTEHHRFVVYRDFALSGLDRKMLVQLYQPMVGAFAASFYQLLYQHLAGDRVGYSALEAQRKLFLGLDLEMSPDGRQTLIEQASRLEAVGLMQVFRRHDPVQDETIYEYALQRPLGAAEFFATVHLALLLRDKIGKMAFDELRESLAPAKPSGLSRFLNREEATVPFYEIFRLSAGSADSGFEEAVAESAAGTERNRAVRPPERIRHADMLLRFPRSSPNRRFVERLYRAPETMDQLNYLAYKYDLEVPEICRLLNEDGVFFEDGTLRWEELQAKANLMYRQDRKREEERERLLARTGTAEAETPGYAPETGDFDRGASGVPPFAIPDRFGMKTSVETYNRMLRNEPYTRMLQRYFPGAVPDAFVRIFERVDLNYKLPEPVINVLIHYVFGMNHTQRLTKNFIDSIASNMLAKGIDTFEKAAVYVREQEKLNETLERRRRGEDDASKGSAAGGGRGRTGPRRKPAMTVVEDRGPKEEIPPEEVEKMRELVRKLKDKG